MSRHSASSIYAQVEDDIASGRLSAGDHLVSVRDLAAQLQVSPTTVASAYRQLRQRGVVVGKGRQGSIVAPRVWPAESQVVSVPAGSIDALRGSPDVRLLPDLGEAFAAAMSRPQASYGDGLVDDGLAEAARAMFERDGIEARNIAVTSGAMDAVERVLAAQGLTRGARIGVEDPGHVPVLQLVRSAGFELIPVPVDEFGITPDGLSAALVSRLDALIVTPRCHNPTGAAFTPERAAELSEILASFTSLVLIQDDHAGLVSGVDCHLLRPPGERHAVIRSLGKSFGPDLRLAVMESDPQTNERVQIAISNGPGWVSHLLQRAAAFLLTDPSSLATISTAAASYAERRDRLVAGLASHGVWSTGRSGLNVWIPTPDEQAAVETARSQGFAIRAADSYRIRSGPAVRVTISNLANDQINALADALGQSRAGAGISSPSM